MIANGVDCEQFHRTRAAAEAKRQLGWPAKGLLIGGVGRLSPEKGFSLLIEAVGELIREGLDLQLMLVGEGGERAALQSQIAARGLDGRVRLLGQRADVVELYEAMDVFVLSSLREGLPNVVLEAMAMGVPVLATEVAGVPALVEHAVNGLCIPPGSASALRDGLRTLVLQPALRRQLAETARQTVERNSPLRPGWNVSTRSTRRSWQAADPRKGRDRGGTRDRADAVQVQVRSGAEVAPAVARQAAAGNAGEFPAFGCNPAWLLVFAKAFQHRVFLLEAVRDGRIVGTLPLSLIRSVLFGRYLVSLPYVNTSGVCAQSAAAAAALVGRAVALAEELDVRYLELRHERELEHSALTHKFTDKVHMRLPLPGTVDGLWDQLKSKVRNQIRKGRSQGFTVHWGGLPLVREFHAVFSHNMRDLGTPVFSRRLFEGILEQFADRAEICVVRSAGRAIGAALLLHGAGMTEVPSASCLRAFHSTNVNMLLYWHLLQRAVERGQPVFDFGRTTVGSNTWQFKKQWDAEPHPAVWQYHVRQGSINAMRPDNARYSLPIRIWKRLPVPLTRLVGPLIARCIP